MRYEGIEKAVFLDRPNRFTALVSVDGQKTAAHVKNTGRCRELLVPGAAVYVQRQDSPTRKTPYSLIAVEKGRRLINIDSQAPNAVWYEALKNGLRLPGWPDGAEQLDIRREVRYGASRLDFGITGAHARQMDPAFAQALQAAVREGVRVLAYDCTVTPGSLAVRAPVPVLL